MAGSRVGSYGAAMGYDDPARRRRTLTPLSGELRAEQRGPAPRRRGLLRSVADRRRRRQPPRTVAGALAWAAVRLALAVGLAAVAAVVAARWLDRPPEIGFYLVGACILGMAFLLSAADVQSIHDDDRAEREYRVRASLVWILVGALVLGIAVVLELT